MTEPETKAIFDETDEAKVPIEETPKCSKCAKALDTTGYPLWCKSCRADYQRSQESVRKLKGFHEGVEAMREFLSRNFATRYPGTSELFTGAEIARIIATVPGPAGEPASGVRAAG